MGMLDNIKKFLGIGEKESHKVQRDDSYEKSMLAAQIVDTVGKIKRINSFDSSIWSISNVTTYELQRKSLSELQSLHSQVSSRLANLSRESARGDKRREEFEASKWTGQKPRDMTSHEFDRFQRGDDR